jgi:hypothetical protein
MNSKQRKTRQAQARAHKLKAQSDLEDALAVSRETGTPMTLLGYEPVFANTTIVREINRPEKIERKIVGWKRRPSERK